RLSWFPPEATQRLRIQRRKISFGKLPEAGAVIKRLLPKPRALLRLDPLVLLRVVAVRDRALLERALALLVVVIAGPARDLHRRRRPLRADELPLRLHLLEARGLRRLVEDDVDREPERVEVEDAPVLVPDVADGPERRPVVAVGQHELGLAVEVV